MKTLKGFLRQRAIPKEGSMEEGWSVQESLVYISKFLSQTDPDTPKLWTNKEDERVTREVPQGNGMPYIMSHDLRDKVNKFCILNLYDMEKWL